MIRSLLGVSALVGMLLPILAGQVPCPDCTDPTRPWLRGSIEKYCNMTQAGIDKLRREHPDKAEHIRLCACEHECDPMQGETDGRKWDPQCEARCSPSNCTCEHPCL